MICLVELKNNLIVVVFFLFARKLHYMLWAANSVEF